MANLLQGLVSGGDDLAPLLDVADPVAGLAGLVGRGIMGLFGGGPTQSQNQEQTQNQNQNQSQTSTSSANSNSSAYNNLTINYPNQSAGMALQGLLGAPNSFNPIGAPGVTQEAASFAPQTGYQAPSLVPVAPAAPAYNPAGSAFMGMAPGGSGGAAAPSVPQNASPAPQEFLSAGPSGGAINPIQAGAGALQAAQAFAPSGSAFPQQAPQMIASAGGGSFSPNPFAPPETATDATNATVAGGGSGGGSAADAVGPEPTALPELPGLKATEAPSPFATVKKKENQTLAEANEPAKSDKDGIPADLYQIPERLPEHVKEKLRKEYIALKYVGQEATNDTVPGTNTPRKLYQAKLVADIDKDSKFLEDARDVFMEHAKNADAQAKELAKQNPNPTSAQGADAGVRGLMDLGISGVDQFDRRAGELTRSRLRGSSSLYSSDPNFGENILRNKGLSIRIGNMLHPERVAAVKNYVNQSYADIERKAKEIIPNELKRQEAIAKEAHERNQDALENLKGGISAARTNLMNNRTMLNADRRLEAKFIEARRSEIFKNINQVVTQTAAGQRQDELQAYRKVQTNLAQLHERFSEKDRIRGREDQEAGLALQNIQLQQREELLQSEINRNMSFGQNPYAQMMGEQAPQPQNYFTPQMQANQHARQAQAAGVQQGVQARGNHMVPPPAPVPVGAQAGGGGFSPQKGQDTASYVRQLAGMGLPKNVILDLVNGARARKEVN